MEELDLKNRLFPQKDGPVLASWFTGPLVCPNGQRKEYVHKGYASTYEKYLVIDIVKGLVTGSSDLSFDEYQEWLTEQFSRA